MPFLEPWEGLSKEGMMWRVLILNHLNLLHVAYKLPKTLKKHEHKQLVDMGKFWFRNLNSEKEDAQLELGRKILKQVLKEEEGWP